MWEQSFLALLPVVRVFQGKPRHEEELLTICGEEQRVAMKGEGPHA